MKILQSKKNISLITIFLLIIGSAFVTFSPYASKPENNSMGSFIQGLKAQDTISYKIFNTQTKSPLVGHITPSKDGTAFLPKFTNRYRGNIAYDLEIKSQNNKSTNILIQYDQNTDQYKLSGDGFGRFQDITYGLGSQNYHSKTDWAGIFTHTDLKNTDSNQKNKNNNIFHIAFNTIHLHDGAMTTPSSLIKVELAVPGGGIGNISNDPTVNQYTQSGHPLLSVNARAIDLRNSTQRLVDNYVAALMTMSEQITAVMFQHIMMVGTIMDAKIQLDTQRDIQILHADAHNDYYPSEQMCVIGTFARSLHNAQSRADFNKAAYSELMMRRLTLEKNNSAALGKGQDTLTRLEIYKNKYCDPSDNNNGLSTLCEKNHGANSNKDIDYARTILAPLTLDIDYSIAAQTEEEEAVLELGKNLYWFTPFTATHNQKAKAHTLLGSRRIMAIGNVAQTSLASLIGQKSSAFQSGEGKNSGAFMKNLVGMLLPTDDPNAPTPTDILGENPSYYAMMEVFTKTMYQDANFYTNLYDKPANVERVKVAMDAIQMMHNRDRYDSMLRSEMLSSLLLETAIVKERKSINAQIERLSTQ